MCYLKNIDKLPILNRQFSDDIEQLQSCNTRMSDVAMGYTYYDSEKSDINEVIKEADSMM